MNGYRREGPPAVTPLRALIDEIESLPAPDAFGRVAAVQGLLVEVAGPLSRIGVGARLTIEAASGRNVAAEVVGFRGERALTLPFAPLDGVRKGCPVWTTAAEPTVRPSAAWLGRVINALGEPIDGKGPLPLGPSPQALKAPPPPAHARGRVGAPIDLGVRALNVVATSDEPALMRRQAAYLTLAVAEHFRDQGRHALVLMDSLTRFAQAQREIGLSVGEPPTTRGYTPTVFTEFPRLLERAGPGTGDGAIT